MSARLLSQVAAFTVAVAMLILASPPAHTQPAEPPDPAVATTLSLSDVGTDTDVWFYDETSLATVSFPVPPGLRPETLNATLNLPFRMRSGTLTVTQDDRLISKVDLPVADFAPVVIPLNAVEVIDDEVTVTLRLAALADEGYCLDRDNPVGLTNGSITYTGIQPPPTTVADFLPSILRTLTIGLPESPSQAESDAAVQLAASLQARYRGQSVQVVLVPLVGDATTIEAPPQPMERRIVLKETPDNGLSLSGGDNAELLITGPADELTNQSRLLTDGSLSMAVSTKVVADNLRFNPVQPGDSTTLAQLGQRVLSNIGVSPQVGIALDQTQFGRSTQGLQVHVMGSHTPVPVEVGARMTALIENQVIDSWPAGADGIIDHWVDIPDQLVQRYTSLIVRVDTSGYVGRCNEFRPITLTVNGSTVVESTRAQPPIPPGFLSMPQALMPRIRFGVNENSFVDTVRATQIIVGLQRLSVVPLLTEVSSLQQAIDSDEPAVLISPDGWTDSSITLPVSEADRRLDLVGMNGGDQATSLILDPGIRFGSLQTVVDGQRSLLVATSNGAPGQLDELLRWLDSDPRGWSKLQGSVVVAVEGREPQLVPGRDAPVVYGPPASPTNTTAQSQNRFLAPGIWIVAGVVAVAIGSAAYWFGARRRSKKET